MRVITAPRFSSRAAAATVAVLCQLSSCPSARAVDVAVEVEEVVTTYLPANNGAGPLWCYGAPLIVRDENAVFLSTIQTGKDVPPLCNTRWQVWRRGADGWRLLREAGDHREREPCPLGVLDGGVFLSVNPSAEPPGTHYGRCVPGVLAFDRDGASGQWRAEVPRWADGTHFTDHSYRGFAADRERGELLLLQINSRTSAQFVSHRDAAGVWHARGTIQFPIRAAYPQVALRSGAAHVLAIGDIVEPVEEWRKLKFEKLGSKWDYVFRRLFYTWTPDVARRPFHPPLEVDTVEKTGGHITNLDLRVDDDGDVHVLYLRARFHHAFLRDRFFPGEPMRRDLVHVVLRNGKTQSQRILAAAPADTPPGLEPSYARFHAAPGGALRVVVAGQRRNEAGRADFGNWLLAPGAPAGRPLELPLEHPFRTFFISAPRGGARPSNRIDLFGVAADAPGLRYARLRLDG